MNMATAASLRPYLTAAVNLYGILPFREAAALFGGYGIAFDKTFLETDGTLDGYRVDKDDLLCVHADNDVLHFVRRGRRPIGFYRPDSAEELLRYERFGFHEETDKVAALRSCLLFRQSMNAQTCELVLNTLLRQFAMCAPIGEMYRLLALCGVHFVSEADRAAFADAAMKLRNETRMWVLGGYTPLEAQKRMMGMLRTKPDDRSE